MVSNLRPIFELGHERCAPRTLDLGRFVRIIFVFILLVDCLFSVVLEWWMPECDLDKVQKRWDQERFMQVSFSGLFYNRCRSLNTVGQLVNRHEEAVRIRNRAEAESSATSRAST